MLVVAGGTNEFNGKDSHNLNIHRGLDLITRVHRFRRVSKSNGKLASSSWRTRLLVKGYQTAPRPQWSERCDSQVLAGPLPWTPHVTLGLCIKILHDRLQPNFWINKICHLTLTKEENQKEKKEKKSMTRSGS